MPQERDFAVNGCLAYGLQARDTEFKNPRALDFAEFRCAEEINEILDEPGFTVVALFVDADGFEISLGKFLERRRRVRICVGPVFLREVDFRYSRLRGIVRAVQPNWRRFTD
jgi:hypothetical protein